MQKGKSGHLVVISYDAFSEDNWEMASKLPNLSKLIKNGAFSTQLKSVYPTLTYVAHSTMVTGVYPAKHGIYHNNQLQPFVSEKEQSWFWFRKEIKAPAIYDVLHKNKMKSAGILWPVTGRASIMFNMPEVRAIKNENQILKVLKNGSPLFCLSLERKFGRFRRGIEQPYLDDYIAMCAADTIKRKSPELLLMHLIDLDDAKHNHGTDSPEIEKVLRRMDERLGMVMKAAEEAGIIEDTVFIVLGDHGQINVRYKVKLNKLLKNKGMIFDRDGKMEWKAYGQSCGGSAYLYLNANDEETPKQLLNILEEAMAEGSYGIESIIDRKEMDRQGVGSDAAFMLEAKLGYCFEDGLEGMIVDDLGKDAVKYATHGYSPEKSCNNCSLVISGECIKSGYQPGEIRMVDIAPTMAEILGLDFPGCDGRALSEIFNN